ncbi:MAG: hypothetical protein ABW161_15825 [Candidatus Thiodiazotropha sp.]
MKKVLGGCHCGNITFEAEMTKEPSAYNPRSCDCKLFTNHGASYASDNGGTLKIRIKNNSEVSKYRQGSKIADFLICKNCGVMTNVIYEEENVVFGSINVRATVNYKSFGEGQVTHLTQLSDEERIERWKNIWFPDVNFEYENA